jgi:hypothetical protein
MSEQREILTEILICKHTYRKFKDKVSKIKSEIWSLDRQITKTKGNKFYRHRHTLWQKEIKQKKEEMRPYKHLKEELQDQIFDLIEMFDDCGPASINEYAVILSTSDIHIERLLGKEAKNLMELIIYHAEDAAYKSDWITDNAVLLECVNWRMMRAIMNDKKFAENAFNKLQELMVDSTGHPLKMYHEVTLPDGSVDFKPAPPDLRIV